MAVKSGPAPTKSKAEPKDLMAFSFADTIAGYVKHYDRNADKFVIETSDGREFTVALTDTTIALLVRNLGEPYVDATAQMRDMLVPGRYMFTYGVFYPQAGAHVYEAKQLTFPGSHAHDYVWEKPDWWVKQIWQMADFYMQGRVGRRRAQLARIPRRGRHDGPQDGRPPGDRHDLAAHLRPFDRLPHDRRRSLPQGGRGRRRVPPRAPPQQRHERGRDLLVSRHRDRRAEREEDPRLGIRRRLPGHPGLRADLRAGRAPPRSSGSPATSGSTPTSTRRSRCSSGSSTTPNTAATGRTSTRSRSTARATRSAATGPARTGTRSATTSRPT